MIRFGYSLVLWYLVAYAATAGLVTRALWLDGSHVTPEQWSYHVLLEQLGFSDHHGHGASHVHVADPDTRALPLPDVPTLTGPTAPAALLVGASPSLHSSFMAAAVDDSLSARVSFDSIMPLGRAAGRPETPPPIGR